LPPCSRQSQHNFAVRDQPVYTANDLKALYELRYLTRMKSLEVQKVGVTQSGSLVDTWVCMCVGHVQSGSFYEVIVLSSVRPETGQHWMVPAVCWRAHNVTRNSSYPTAMQHGVCRSRLLITVFRTALSCQLCVQNCPVVSTLCSELPRPVNTVRNCPVLSTLCSELPRPVNTDPLPSLPYSLSPSDIRLCLYGVLYTVFTFLLQFS
jgi:hypothetical protein